MRKARTHGRRLRGCLWKLFLLGVIAAIGVLLVGEHVFNLRSTAGFLAFRDSTNPLEVRLSRGTWKPVHDVTVAEMDRALVRQRDETGAVWRTLKVRRQAQNLWQRVVGTLVSFEVAVVEISPANFRFQTSFLDKFAPTTAEERIETEQATFAVTANFRDPQGKPLGMVYHQGTQRNATFPVWSGYFFVKGGKPYCGPKSLLEETPGELQEACQVYPSLMKNHTIFSYVDLAPNRYFDGNKITYRALAGMRQNGTMVFILSGTGGVMNVSEVAALAQKLNVQHATLLDGGRALQYSLRIRGRVRHFTAFNTQFDFDSEMLERQRSPVYIIAKPLSP